jgi:O-antigen ligase
LIFLGIFYYLINLSSFEQFIMSIGLSDQLRLENFSTAGGRTEAWAVAWEEIKNSFWIGKGLLYDNYYIKDYVANYFGSNYARHWGGVWNSYLSLLLDVGFIGVLVYIIFWIRIFKISKILNLSVAFILMCFLSAITESWMAASMNPFSPLMFLFWAIQSQPLVKFNNNINT